jgi:hypothetical protein
VLLQKQHKYCGFTNFFFFFGVGGRVGQGQELKILSLRYQSNERNHVFEHLFCFHFSAKQLTAAEEYFLNHATFYFEFAFTSLALKFKISSLNPDAKHTTISFKSR